MKYFAHTGRKPDRSDWQELHVHLRTVADLARRFAGEACRDSDWLTQGAYAAGLLHDLGKYRPEFQTKLVFESQQQVAPVAREATYHKQAGAAKAASAGHSAVAFAIAGHHGGLPNKMDLVTQIRSASGKPVGDAVWALAETEIPELSQVSFRPPPLAGSHDADLFIRLLFSCLVDADWADTAAHARFVRNLAPEESPSVLAPGLLLDRVLAFIETKSRACRERRVAQARADVLAACLAAAERPPGLFSLTVPTGGAKTLSGLAFAMKHAASHELRRFIYVAPYLSILDQNAQVIRESLGIPPDSPDLLEHHSLAEPQGGEEAEAMDLEADARRAENWDAPIVVTTSVQFLESLFSNLPSRSRKLHNIARSVIMLDECQSLPPRLVAATCGMLKQLVDNWDCSIVLCTATQPAFDHDELQDNERLHACEIVPPSLRLFDRLKRVTISWPASANDTLSWTEVAEAMVTERTWRGPAALCVVNTRRAARELFAELRQRTADGVFHLSTSMCPAHRLAVLAEVRNRLKNGSPCFLVSTQLIEAGVDVDFPFVLRELAPLEAVIQAAGRCNREGTLNSRDGSPGGRVAVFRSRASVEEP